jgi:hypothetical protein
MGTSPVIGERDCFIELDTITIARFHFTHYAIQRCTAGKPVRSYEEKLCVTEHNVQHDTIPPCARACPNERPRRDKKIRPPIFTSGRKLV